MFIFFKDIKKIVNMDYVNSIYAEKNNLVLKSEKELFSIPIESVDVNESIEALFYILSFNVGCDFFEEKNIKKILNEKKSNDEFDVENSSLDDLVDEYDNSPPFEDDMNDFDIPQEDIDFDNVDIFDLFNKKDTK